MLDLFDVDVDRCGSYIHTCTHAYIVDVLDLFGVDVDRCGSMRMCICICICIRRQVWAWVGLSDFHLPTYLLTYLHTCLLTYLPTYLLDVDVDRCGCGLTSTVP